MLIEHFLKPLVNLRSDGNSGSIEARNRLALEIERATVSEISQDRIGVRLSPFGAFHGAGEVPEVQAQYLRLAKSLSPVGLLFIRLVENSAMGARPVPADFKLTLRTAFNGLFTLCDGFDHARAEQALTEKRSDNIAFGRPFLDNRDLVARTRKDAPLNAPTWPRFVCPAPMATPTMPPWQPDQKMPKGTLWTARA